MNHIEIASIVQSNYGLHSLHIDLLQSRASRIVVKLSHTSGSVVAKINTEPASFPRIKRDLYFAEYVALKGLSLPRIHRTRHGNSYVETENGLLYLVDFIEGDTPQPNPVFFQQAGTLLGQLHALPIQTYHYQEQFTITEEIPYVRAGFNRCRQLHRADHAQQLEMMFEQLSTLRSPHTTLIHSDFFVENLRMTSAGKLYLLDFDDGGLGDPLLDVGYFIAAEMLEDCFYPSAVSEQSSVASSLTSAELVEAGKVTLNHEKLQEFFEAYCQRFPLQSRDIADIVAYINFATLWYLYDLDDAKIKGTNFRRFDWLQRNAVHLQKALSACLPII